MVGLGTIHACSIAWSDHPLDFTFFSVAFLKFLATTFGFTFSYTKKVCCRKLSTGEDRSYKHDSYNNTKL